MNDWKWVKISEIIDFNPKERLLKGSISKKIAMEKIEPFTRDISEFERLEFKGGTKFRNGDTLIARITPSLENGKTAKVNLLDEDEIGFGSTEFIVARAKKGISDENFVYYLMLDPKVREVAIKSMVGTSGRQRVQLDVVQNYEILCPPLEEQIQIGRILSVIDDKIENNKKINHHLAELIDAQFAHLLEDNELYKSTFSEIGEIVGGGTPSKKVDDYWNGDIPWLSPKDLSLNPAMFTGRGQNSITELGYKKSSAKLMPRNSILFSSRAPIGYITIAENDISTNQGFKSIIPKPEYPYTFVYELLKQETPSLESSASGSTFKEVSGTHLKNHEIRIPPHSAIIKFHESVEPLFKTINLNEKEIQKLIEVRDLLLPTLMSGEISVSD
ncbi:TPA: restriction endonuclease subunit S [Streptococcus suis]|nr:restriction endonuclease subunit S [Streptococcus suis]HEL1696124.1 restriction endonuclease subunit S [Streptococcus suis]HEL1920251.1 restriction endonuclease subunit S [Streptococcus suis]HEL2711431.1 restriction endonuclease subunit S [Streptococcus suis]